MKERHSVLNVYLNLFSDVDCSLFTVMPLFSMYIPDSPVKNVFDLFTVTLPVFTLDTQTTSQMNILPF